MSAWQWTTTTLCVPMHGAFAKLAEIAGSQRGVVDRRAGYD
ncbi:hypothetical protein [Dactylosporangium salmoneum]